MGRTNFFMQYNNSFELICQLFLVIILTQFGYIIGVSEGIFGGK